MAGRKPRMPDMRRREFITLLGGATAMAWPLRAVAQVSGKRPLVAWLSLGERTASWAFIQSFLQGMRDFGYAEGSNFDFVPRFADGYIEHLPALAQELVQLRPRVILAPASGPAVAAKAATAVIPDRQPRARRCGASGAGRERGAAERQRDRHHPIRRGIARQADGACARGRARRSPGRRPGQPERPESTAAVARAGGSGAAIGSEGRRGRRQRAR